ncbi:unnamed protein product, partial [Adineta steineri]
MTSMNSNRFINEQVCELRDVNHSPVYSYQQLPILALEEIVKKILRVGVGL